MAQTRTKSLFDKLYGDKRGYDIIKFPQDIDVNGSQNIILLNINAVDGSKYTGVKNKAIQGETATYRQPGSSSLTGKMSGISRRIDTSIALYTPNNLQTNYGADWSTTEIGGMGAAIDAGLSITDMSAKEAWEAAKEIFPQALQNTAVGFIDVFTPGNLKDAKAVATRRVNNPYMEVVFNGVSNRTFSFTFKFIPRNATEQQTVKQIIDTLKFHRAPEIKGSKTRAYWLFPSEFDITFLYSNIENPYLMKISTCAMTNMGVSQGADDRFATHKDGGPVVTDLTLEFTELETLTKERHLQGF